MLLTASAGFDLAHENYIFTMEDIKPTSTGPQEFTNVAIIRRFTVQTERDVIRDLRLKANGIRDNPDGQSSGGLEQAMRGLPDYVLSDIITGDGECIRYIKRSIPSPVDVEGKAPDEKLHITFGYIPTPMIEKRKREEGDPDFNWYMDTLSNGFLNNARMGERWRMVLRLDNGDLPDRGKVYTLVNDGTTNSWTIKTIPGPYVIKDALGVVGLLYDSYRTRESIEELPDISYLALQEDVGKAIKSLLTNSAIQSSHQQASDGSEESTMRSLEQDPQLQRELYKRFSEEHRNAARYN